jgi:hypothetical protein
MRKDDLLPKQIRLMTEDGLQFVASYRGMIALAKRQQMRGGPFAGHWEKAARSVSEAVETDCERSMQVAVANFTIAARTQGWTGA